MTKPSVFRAATLFILLALTSTTFGWIPFHADFTLHTVPEGATVYKDGQLIGTTPYRSHIFHFDHNYEVRHEGFYDKKQTINYSAAKHIYVKMRATPVLLQTKPNADIYDVKAAKPFGKTPLEVNVYHKDRTYILKAKDYFDKEITIGLATETPMVLELERRPIITLTIVPNGTEIYENDELFATTTMTEEILTNRTFELRKEGYYNKSLELTSTSPADIDVELVPLPIITIKTTPADATVYRVGQDAPVGTGDLTLTIDQETSFEVKADRYYSETFTVDAKTQTTEVNLDAMPYVTITSKPAGAKIIVGGKAVGTTPTEQLIEKATTAELSLDGYLPKTVTLDGKDLTPLITLEKEVVVEEAPAVSEQAQSAPESTPSPEKKKDFWQRMFAK